MGVAMLGLSNRLNTLLATYHRILPFAIYSAIYHISFLFARIAGAYCADSLPMAQQKLSPPKYATAKQKA